jgi:hypothetical protein
VIGGLRGSLERSEQVTGCFFVVFCLGGESERREKVGWMECEFVTEEGMVVCLCADHQINIDTIINRNTDRPVEGVVHHDLPSQRRYQHAARTGFCWVFVGVCVCVFFFGGGGGVVGRGGSFVRGERLDL